MWLLKISYLLCILLLNALYGVYSSTECKCLQNMHFCLLCPMLHQQQTGTWWMPNKHLLNKWIAVVVQSLSHVWLCDPMDCSTLGFPVLHCLPDLAQTHVHWVSDAITTSHPLLPPSPSAFNLAQHRGLYQWFGFLHQVAKELALQLPYQSFQWVLRVDFLYDWLVWSLLSKGLSRVYSSTTVQKHQFFCAQPSLWSNSHICTWVLGKP